MCSSQDIGCIETERLIGVLANGDFCEALLSAADLKMLLERDTLNPVNEHPETSAPCIEEASTYTYEKLIRR